MARPNRLKELEKEYGPLVEVIPNLVNELGSAKAAAEKLGVSDSTIVTWLKKHGYVPETTYRKREELVGEN